MTPLESSFSKYELTDQEELQGTILSPYQIARLSNLRTEAAESLLALKIDPAKINEYLQEQANYQAQIKVYTYLIESSTMAVEAQMEAQRVLKGENAEE